MSTLRKQFNPKKVPKSRVELHLHLDGSLRTSTIWDLANKKGFKIGQSGSLADIEQAVRVYCPQTLREFLGKFSIFIPLLGGDAQAIERVAYELCEDQASEGVAYFEARYSPIFLTSPSGDGSGGKKLNLTNQEVVDAVTRGLERGGRDFGVKSNQILCIICGHSDRNEEIYELIRANKDKGVVALDVAGDEKSEAEIYEPSVVSVFHAAKAEGIHRTVHAAEAGSSENVRQAREELFAERIGHGYRVVQDAELYQECLRDQVHFECCPYSSILTGAVSSSFNKGKHPIVQFAEDKANFSINKDDTTITGTTLDDEYALLTKLGLTEAHFVKANLDAAMAAFLPQNEKDALLKHLLSVYGIPNM